MWQIEFTTNKFKPYLPEECQVNPGVYGFELAQWLSKELASMDIVTSYPNEEDWGWFLDYSRDGIEVMICCGSMVVENEPSPEKNLQWAVFIKPLLSLTQKWKGRDAEPVVRFLSRSIVEILEKEGITIRQT